MRFFIPNSFIDHYQMVVIMNEIVVKEQIGIELQENLIYQQKEKILRSGRSAHLPLRSALREHCWIGDEVEVKTYRKGINLVIEIIRKVLNFDLDEIEKICKEYKLRIVDQRTIADIKILQATHKNIVLSCTENLLNDGRINLTITNTIPNVDYNEYIKQKTIADGKNIIVQPEGNVDTINILDDPSQYKVTLKQAFSALKKDRKKIGMSILYRFNNKDHKIEEIKNILREFLN